MPSFLQIYRSPLILAFIVLLLAAFEPVTGQWLRFDRAAMAAGEWWRFFTAHLVHLSWGHALGNLGGLALFAYITGRYCSQLPMLLFFLFSCLFVSLSLFLFAPDLYFYVGLSGVLHGLLLLGGIRSPFYANGLKVLFVVIIVAKVIWEQSPFYDDLAMVGYIGGRVETRAHLFGSISAFLWLAAGYLKHYFAEVKAHG